jgi:hypothetical protein
MNNVIFIPALSGTVVTESIPWSAEGNTGTPAGTASSVIKKLTGAGNKFLAVIKTASTDEVFVVTTNGASAPTFGTSVNLLTFHVSYGLGVATDKNTNDEGYVAVADASGSLYGKACHITVSGTTPTKGSYTTYVSAASQYNQVACDSQTADKGLVVYRGPAPNYYGYAICFTQSGGTLTFGSAVQIGSTAWEYPSLAADPNNADKYVCVYSDYGTSPTQRKAVIITTSGTTVTVNTPVTLSDTASNAYTASYQAVCWDAITANKFHTVYHQAGDSNYPRVHGCTVSGTTITPGTREIVESQAGAQGMNISSDPVIPDTLCLSRARGTGDDKLYLYPATVSGTDYTVGTKVEFDASGFNSTHGLIANPNVDGEHLMLWGDSGTTRARTARLGGEY